jgi:transposase
MAYFAGLDVSVKETSVCIVDDAGKIVREVRVASEPEALLQVFTNTNHRFKRKAAYMTEIESWRELPGDRIEFTMRRLPSAD